MPNNSQLSFIERIANSLSLSINDKTVFSDPIEFDGIKIIPVTKIRYGFGGGYSHEESGSTGKGGGGGIVAQPVGYIEFKNGQTSFKPIQDFSSLSTLVLTSGITGFLLLKGVAKLFRK